VVARKTTEQWKAQAADMRELGRQLGVSHLIEGTLQRKEGRVRLTMQIVAADTGRNVWSGLFEEREPEAFEAQDRVTAPPFWCGATWARRFASSSLRPSTGGSSSRASGEQLALGERILAAAPARAPFRPSALGALDDVSRVGQCIGD
jgi:hypothetical protein